MQDFNTGVNSQMSTSPSGFHKWMSAVGAEVSGEEVFLKKVVFSFTPPAPAHKNSA